MVSRWNFTPLITVEHQQAATLVAECCPHLLMGVVSPPLSMDFVGVGRAVWRPSSAGGRLCRTSGTPHESRHKRSTALGYSAGTSRRGRGYSFGLLSVFLVEYGPQFLSTTSRCEAAAL